MLKYIKLNKTKLGYIMIKKFKDRLKDLKAIFEEIKKLEIIEELEIEQIKKIVKELEIEKVDELEKLHEKLRFEQ